MPIYWISDVTTMVRRQEVFLHALVAVLLLGFWTTKTGRHKLIAISPITHCPRITAKKLTSSQLRHRLGRSDGKRQAIEIEPMFW